jgi:Uri superfamily endonuclease
MKTITILGSNEQSGAYLLRMSVRKDVAVRFGRFQGGRPIFVPKGEVLYVGSAMAQQGSMTLARRLLRHATRRDEGNPQQIQGAMLKVFEDVGLGTVQLKPPDRKKLFWNVDYLLEEDVVDLSHVVIIRTRIKFEDELAQFLEAEPKSSALAKGLGAHDSHGRTHILILQETADWWQQLPTRLEELLTKVESA